MFLTMELASITSSNAFHLLEKWQTPPVGRSRVSFTADLLAQAHLKPRGHYDLYHPKIDPRGARG